MKANYQHFSALLCAAVLSSVGLLSVWAQSVPSLINYQGKLVNSNGVPLATGDHELHFSLWDAAIGGTQVWGSQHFDNAAGPGHGAKVPVVQGWFNVILGPVDTTGASLTEAFNDTNRHLEIRVGTNPPVLPRQQILSAPYALRAEAANTATSALLASNSLSVANGAITFATLSPEVFAKLNPVRFMEFVTVDNPGNPNDATGYGAVNYTYRIGKFEVNNDQYAAFLNAVAATDAYNLRYANMDIYQFGSPGSYTYAAHEGRGKRPVDQVSWYSALRFCNWLHNGRPNGTQNAYTTEDGAYTFTGATTVGGRKGGARYWLPSENEWYKAAYHQPANAGGDSDNYWLYPTKSNVAPTAEGPPGGTNSANYNLAAGRDFANVGAYTNSPSYYGTFDQGGNVWEWNEAINDSNRMRRGGAYGSESADELTSSYRRDEVPGGAPRAVGFRVATSLPEQ